MPMRARILVVSLVNCAAWNLNFGNNGGGFMQNIGGWFEQVQDDMGEFGDQVEGFFDQLGDDVGDHIDGFIEGLGGEDGVMDEIGGFVEQIGESAGGVLSQVGGQVWGRIQDRLAEVHEECPRQALECGVPTPGTDLLSMVWKLGETRNVVMCMQQSGCPLPIGTALEQIEGFVSQIGGEDLGQQIGGFVEQIGDSAGGVLSQVGSQVWGRIQDRLAEVHEECPRQALECGVPTPGTDVLSMVWNLGNTRDVVMCMQQNECPLPIGTMLEQIEGFVSQIGGEGGLGQQIGGFVDQIGENVGGFIDQIGEGVGNVGGFVDQIGESAGGFVDQVGGQVWGRIQERLAEVHAACPEEALECGVPTPGTDFASLDDMSFRKMRQIKKCMRRSGCRVSVGGLMGQIKDFLSELDGGDFVDQIGGFMNQIGSNVGNWWDQVQQQQLPVWG